ncbi:MAG: hypothetical protein AAGC60_23865 [Acidobacteriota bacterium]
MSPQPGRRLGSELLRVGSWTAPPFALLAVFLVLHRLGVVPRHPNIAYERTLILDLVLYWAAVAALVLAWQRRVELLRWLRGHRGEVALLAVSLVLGAVFLEVALRLVRPDAFAPPFERLPSATVHHENAPSRSSLGMGGARVVTNADGFRTERTRDEYLTANHRVALLGDSFVFGLGVEAREAIGAVLEEQLQRHLQERAAAGRGSVGETVHVLNTGVISYSPLLERQAYLHAVRAYRPSTVVTVLDLNDIGDDYGYTRELIGGPAALESTSPEALRFDVPAPAPRSLCERLALCRAAQPAIHRLTLPFTVARNVLGWNEARYSYYDFEITIDGVVETNRFFVLRHPLEATRPHFDRTFGLVQDLAGLVRADGADFAFVVSPRYVHWDDTEAPNNWEGHRYAVDEPYEMEYFRYFDEAAQGADFPVWSLLPFFERPESLEVDAGPLVFDHDPHWNARGHQVAGRALARLLIDAGWPDSLTGPEEASDERVAEESAI